MNEPGRRVGDRNPEYRDAEEPHGGGRDQHVSTRYAPRDSASRQYVDATAAERAKRYRDRKLGVTRDGLNGTVTVTALDQKQNKRTEQTGVTGLIEVTDEQALRAWDEHGRATTGKPYPRNRRGGWRFPAKWPPDHEAEVVAGPARSEPPVRIFIIALAFLAVWSACAPAVGRYLSKLDRESRL